MLPHFKKNGNAYFYAISSLPAEFYNPGKRISLQACTADKGAVNVLLPHELIDIVGLDAAAVENAQAHGHLSAGKGCNQRPDRLMHLFGLGRRCRLARADCPDRLIGDDDFSYIIRRQFRKAALDLFG